MATEPTTTTTTTTTATSTPPPPAMKAPSALWQWTKRIGCTVLLLSLTCCGSICGGVWYLDHQARKANKDEVDRFHVDGLRGGNVKEMHDRADERFRQKFKLEDLEALLQAKPGLLDRENVQGVEFVGKDVDGIEFVKVRWQPKQLPLDIVDIVFKIVDGVYVLVGVLPGMEEFVPRGIRTRILGGGGGGGGRRLRFWRH